MRWDLGGIQNGQITLTPVGVKIDQCWNEIPEHHPHAEIWDYVIMPNHFHGIIYIKEGATSDERMNQFSKPVSGSISVIINGFKAAVKRWCNQNGVDFTWKPRFHDSIIRDERHFTNVRNYIARNPSKWEEDKGEHLEFEE